MKIHSVIASLVVLYGRTDMKKLTTTLRNSTKAPINN